MPQWIWMLSLLLTPRETKSFTLLDYETPAPRATVISSCHLFLAGKSLLDHDKWAESQVRSCYVTAHHDPTQLLQAKVPGHLVSFTSTQVFGKIFGLQGHFQIFL